MSPDRLFELVGKPGGPLADAHLFDLEVVATRALSPHIHRIVLGGGGLAKLVYKPGQDLMLRVPVGDDAVVNRRYTIRSFRTADLEVVIDVSLHGSGPGTDWVRAADVGSSIQAIGPRGKITLDLDADWHLFCCDETGLPGALAMIEALPVAGVGVGLIEVDGVDDEQAPREERPGVALRWLHRDGLTAPGDAELLVGAVEGFEMLEGRGHAYLSAELRVVRRLQEVLADRGFAREQISAKAYWRRGLPNAEHGEPLKDA